MENKSLNLKKLESRMTKTVSTKDALKDVTPFVIEPHKTTTKIKIIECKDRNQCVKKET